MEPKRSKYGSRAVYVDSTTGAMVPRSHPNAKKIADSEKEYKHWLYLVALSKLGLIQGLERQKTFRLHVPGPDGTPIVVARYKADFTYHQGSRRHVVDVKGKRTEVYELKRRWMLAEYGITIEEV